jgi:recombinational DNA repair ATPase RecF
MKLVRLKINDDFRSLKKGFEIDFRDAENPQDLNAFRPFCFVGLNGSGKSNVLEALTSIFFHLERCYRNYQPESFKEYFKKNECNPNAFEIEYYYDLDIANRKTGQTIGFYIKVVKEIDKEPVFYKKEKAKSNVFTENHKIITNEVII